MAMEAMWVQASDAAATASTNHLVLIFIGLVAFVMVVQAIVLVTVAVKTQSAIQQMVVSVEATKEKLLPLIQTSTETVTAARALLKDTAPKIQIITDNLVDTSRIVRGTAQQLGTTVSDANMRTQRQVARVDGMVTAILVTTGEVAETISQNIRVPAQKIAVMATQAKTALEDLLNKVKSFAAKAAKRPGGPA